MDLLEKMRETERFSEREQKVVEYLLKNPSETLTIQQLAEKTYTSKAMVVRMCQKLGFDGYRQFKEAFIKAAESRKYVVESIDYSQPFQKGEGVSDFIHNMGVLYKESVDLLMGSIREKTILQISRAIQRARRVYIYAIGDSMMTAKSFANKLVKLDIYPIIALEGLEDVTNCYNITNDDCVIFLSYSLEAASFRKAFTLLKKRHPTVVAITANEQHLITKSATYRVVIPKKETSFKIATFYSQFAFEYICNVIYSVIYMDNYEQNKERKDNMDRLHSFHIE
jgi:DNA-binding MurR/RpiR family transcriptional regulator